MVYTKSPHTEQVHKTVLTALDVVKAENIVTIDVDELTSLFDSIIIASTHSTRQSKAGARVLQEEIKKIGGKINGIEGENLGEWVLVDLGEIVVHIMEQKTRDYYDLESLWVNKARSIISI